MRKAGECLFYALAACTAVVRLAVAAKGGDVEGSEAIKGVAGVVVEEA